MPAQSSHIYFTYLIALSGAIQLAAQSPHTYARLSDGSSGRIIVVNASPKTIEAFHFKAADEGCALEFSRDLLDQSGHTGLPGLDGGRPIPADVIEPWGRMVLMDRLEQPRPGCHQKPEIEAVIYADGTYEGDEVMVRYLQAQRDGIAAGLKYWTDRFGEDQTAAPNFEATQADAERFVARDLKKSRYPEMRQSPIARGYWLGRRIVDQHVVGQGKLDKDNPRRNPRMVQDLTQWQIKLNKNAALKILDATFPLPPDIAAAANEQWTPKPSQTP